MVEGDRKNKEVRPRRGLKPVSSTSIPWWVSVIVLLGAVLMTAGGLMALLHPAHLVSAHDALDRAGRGYAGYLASRNLALALLLLVALVLRARGTLNSFMLLTAFIQLLDAGIDGVEGRWAIVPGVIFLGLLFSVASWRLSGHPFWKIEAWRQDRLGF